MEKEISTAPGQDFMLEDLKDCKVKIKGGLAAIRMRQLRRSTVEAGPIAGSAFLEGTTSDLN